MHKKQSHQKASPFLQIFKIKFNPPRPQIHLESWSRFSPISTVLPSSDPRAALARAADWVRIWPPCIIVGSTSRSHLLLVWLDRRHLPAWVSLRLRPSSPDAPPSLRKRTLRPLFLSPLSSINPGLDFQSSRPRKHRLWILKSELQGKKNKITKPVLLLSL